MINLYARIQKALQNYKHYDMHTLRGGEEHSFSNGMVVDGLHCSKCREIFNWADILTFSIFHSVRNAPYMKNPSFYMYAYLIDVVCSII
jgi:hypothetical protein